MCFLTTNHIERFDEAMLRTGRMNDIFHVDHLSREGAAEMVAWFIQRYYACLAPRRGELAARMAALTQNPSSTSAFMLFMFSNRRNPKYGFGLKKAQNSKNSKTPEAETPETPETLAFDAMLGDFGAHVQTWRQRSKTQNPKNLESWLPSIQVKMLQVDGGSCFFLARLEK